MRATAEALISSASRFAPAIVIECCRRQAVKAKFMFRLSLILATALSFSLAGAANAELKSDFLMLTDPEFHDMEPVKDFQRDFKGLWLQALQRPEADYQRLAAETVARGHEHGIPGLIELVPVLEKILSEPNSHPAARFAAARALIVLESRDSAAKLFEAGLSHGADLRQLVEPAVAKWEFVPAREVWKKRLDDARTFPRDLLLALGGLGQAQDAGALAAITKLALDVRQPLQIRLEAARVAGQITDSGLESDAAKLARDRRTNPLINRLCAIRFLGRHTSESARLLLLELAKDSNPSVAAAAMNQLNEIDPEMLLPLTESAMKNADPHVREAGAKTYLKVPTPARMKPLVQLLNDDHPSVRGLVAEELYRLAEKPELKELILAEAMPILAGDRWQGQVQATLLLGMLEHKDAAARFVELLESPRVDVMTTAAWGLRKVAEPKTIDAILDRIRRQTVELLTRAARESDQQVAHLFEACGKMRVKDAEPLMLPFVPKDTNRATDVSRSAAIWALGQINLGTPNESLANELIDRIRDDAIRPPESLLVKQMSIVALVRMKATSQSEALKRTLPVHQPGSALDVAVRWAVKELSGEEMPAPTPPKYPEGVWFLEPLNTSAAN